MGIIIGAIAAAHQKSKERYKSKKSKKEYKVELDKDGMKPYTQEHLKWVEDGLCGCCGAPSGEEKGICDECRWS